jgi:hypothetical protein
MTQVFPNRFQVARILNLSTDLTNSAEKFYQNIGFSSPGEYVVIVYYDEEGAIVRIKPRLNKFTKSAISNIIDFL